MQVTKSTQIVHKKQEQRKQSLNNGVAAQPIKSTLIPIQKDLRMTHHDQVLEEEQASKKIIEQNFVKRQVRSIVGNQDQGLAQEHTFKKIDEQTKGFCQSKSVKRWLIRCTTKNQVEGSMEQAATKKKKTVSNVQLCHLMSTLIRMTNKIGARN